MLLQMKGQPLVYRMVPEMIEQDPLFSVSRVRVFHRLRIRIARFNRITDGENLSFHLDGSEARSTRFGSRSLTANPIRFRIKFRHRSENAEYASKYPSAYSNAYSAYSRAYIAYFNACAACTAIHGYIRFIDTLSQCRRTEQH